MENKRNMNNISFVLLILSLLFVTLSSMMQIAIATRDSTKYVSTPSDYRISINKDDVLSGDIKEDYNNVTGVETYTNMLLINSYKATLCFKESDFPFTEIKVGYGEVIPLEKFSGKWFSTEKFSGKWFSMYVKYEK